MDAETFARIATSALALIVVIGVFVMLGLGIAIPVELWAAFGLIIGYFFGNQTGEARARAR
jgi:hypothetical protein